MTEQDHWSDLPEYLSQLRDEIELLRAALTDIVGLTEGYADQDDLMDTLCGTAKAALRAHEQQAAWSQERCRAVDRSNIPATCDWPRCCGNAHEQSAEREVK
jgi:hypothetical protein